MMASLSRLRLASPEGVGLLLLAAYAAYGLFWLGSIDERDRLFFYEVTLSGLLAGVMYSLVALGFVLIFKSSGIFNFSQGVMALFAGLFLTGFMNDFGVPAFLAIPLTVAVMVAVAFAVERFVLRHLVNQEPIILFMATIGLAFVLEGVGDILWGSDVKPLDVGLPRGASDFLLDGYGLYVEKLEIAAAAVAAVLVVALSLFSQYTRIGRALRAVADDHQAALSVGISLRTIWVIVWSIAGAVALVAGIMWGSKSGVQFSLALIALKALPVLILGGFTSIPGAILGGLIIGVGEKWAEIYLGEVMNALFGLNASWFTAIENWFAYVLALAFLLVRPQGLFGEKIIERV
ncbi:branched-chain amino acid ABC transporter permease [Rubrimonas cliftonensis]|uniref:Amino acid/amide ABC transporter membrane protein 1, HAAT family n=1 Tax=Rubrimonas cliftonensis TaxID=89524 RepID=A0A1H4EIF1_9RHOB|nr:branched-chain amino acid ABC transporter permease [Rubrimonas cliftonensis]SEA84854.1 amino acid/amide ABC transporter membrane protein 1, HAAT family [Rubrimonas cliftonensis]